MSSARVDLGARSQEPGAWSHEDILEATALRCVMEMGESGRLRGGGGGQTRHILSDDN